MQKLQGCTSVKVSLSVLLRLKLGDELLWMATMAGIKVTKQIRYEKKSYMLYLMNSTYSISDVDPSFHLTINAAVYNCR